MTKKGKLARLRTHLGRGKKKIAKIAGYQRRRRKAIKRLLAEQGAIAMFDNVDVAQLPPTAPAVGGYVDGAWPTFETLRKDFPHAWKLSIATSPSSDAHCLDVERGDGVPADVPAWLKRQFAGWAGDTYRPAIYVDKSEAPEVIAVCKAAGFKPGVDYRLWVADWTYEPHICSPSSCGATFSAQATQWTDRADGCDQSLCAAGFFPGAR